MGEDKEIRRTLQNLLPGTRYATRVRAWNEFGIHGEWSEAMEFETHGGESSSGPTALVSPNAPTIQSQFGAIQVLTPYTFANDGIGTYIIEHSADNTTWTEIDRTPVPIYIFVTNPGVTHYFRFSVVDIYGFQSPVSPSNSGVALSATAMAKPYATFVVAVNDSAAPGKTNVDYLCDGVDDHVQINAALVAAQTTGGTVLLLEGNYHLGTEAVLNIPPKVRVRGQGRDSTIIHGSSSSWIVHMAGQGGELTDVSLINTPPTTGSAIVYLDDSTFGTVSDCYFSTETIVEYAILAHGGHGFAISNNNFIGGNMGGIHLDGKDISHKIYDVRIEGNFLNQLTTGFLADGRIINCIFSGNTIEGVDGVAISFISTSVRSYGNVISGNTVEGFGGYNDIPSSGVLLDGTLSNTVVNNNFDTEESIIILRATHRDSEGNNVSMNVGSSDLSSYSVWLDGTSSNNLRANIITGNNLGFSETHGIMMEGANCYNNTVSENTIQSSGSGASNTYDGIHLQDGASYNRIIGNMLSNTDKTGAADFLNAKYSINVATSDCKNNLITLNDGFQGYITAFLNDLGTDTNMGAGNRVTTGWSPTFIKATGGGGETVSSHGATGTTETINLDSGNVHAITLNANCTLTFTGATSDKSCSFTLIATQDSTGSRLVTWPTSVKWTSGIAPTVSTAPNAVDLFTFVTIDGGITWYGFFAGMNMS